MTTIPKTTRKFNVNLAFSTDHDEAWVREKLMLLLGNDVNIKVQEVVGYIDDQTPP